MAYTPGQEKCIHTLDRPLVVAAGAGSGKTFTLTKRIVHAIQSGAVDGVDRVCAITFTNKAAGELKSRIKSELRACGLADQALAVDEAWVSTIHGMCARILRAHAIELDLDPAFKMADDSLVDLLRDRAIEEVLAIAQSGSSADETVLADERSALGGDVRSSAQQAYGPAANLPNAQAVDALFSEYPARSYAPRTTSVETMMRFLVEMAGSRPDGFDSFAVDAANVNPAALLDTALEAYESLAASAASQKPNEAREAWAASTLEQTARIRDDLQKGHAGDCLWALKALDSLSTPKKVGTADYRRQVGEALEAYRMCVMELRLAMGGEHLNTIIGLAQMSYALFAAAKREAGVLDNNDLLVLAYSAVTENPEIAALYSDKFQLVMVDEFQDTDQMQVDMIKALSGPGACRLCTVGDAQQSIYRFRGADVSVYNRHLKDIERREPDDVIKLADNFRSHADVLSFVDRVFEQPNVFGGEFMSLSPGRDEARVNRPFGAHEPRIKIQMTSTGYHGAKSEEVRQTAAERIAEVFADLHAKGHSAGEMALLLGGMTYAGVYAKALREKGLACVISGGSVFSRTPEAQLVRDLANVLANPFQTQSLHNVLTSPLFELEAADLIELATVRDEADGHFRRRNLASGVVSLSVRLRRGEVDDAWSGRLASALRVMGEAIDAVGNSNVSRIIARVLVDSGLLSRLQAQGPEGLASAANYFKAVRMVESIESSGGVGPAGVALAYQALLNGSKEAPGALSATGGDFVRIMTVHASKGLEFPIVAVAEFKESGASASKLLASEVGGRVYLSLDLMNTVTAGAGPIKLKDLPELYGSLMCDCADEDELARAVERAEGALYRRAALFEYERLGDEEESKRLLYVALTRAKEALVVSLRGKGTKDNPYATPKGCMGSIVSALAGSDGGFAIGRSQLDYRGSLPADVERVDLQPEDAAASGEAGASPNDDGSAGTAAAALAAVPFAVPMPEPFSRISRMPFAPAHDGVFSYSAIADASHEGDVLERLADLFFESADEGFQSGLQALFLKPSDEVTAYAGGTPGSFDGSRVAAVADEDDGSWAYVGSSCADSDKATDLGTAFHRLAQYSVVTRGGSGHLAMPGEERIDALCRACNLDQVQRERLNEALVRWFSSDVAKRMSSYSDLRAEIPFFLELPHASMPRPTFMEGEIDLLGIDADAGLALVVDYKTGGRDDEAVEELACKHVLQAACYAYALIKQGFKKVRTVFVRVERTRADQDNQPQCVRYRFGEGDAGVLEQAIEEVYARMVSA